MSPPPIALLTDYGHKDAYAGVLRAVIFGICPDARFLDLSHEVPPQNIMTGAHLIASAAPYLPRGSIVLAVVDPGVGGGRRALCIKTERLLLVGPDNGLFSLLLRSDSAEKAVELDQSRFHLPSVSATFHGRDIFAPVAAHLANDIPFNSIGTPVVLESLVQIPLPEPVMSPDRIECHVMHVDGFGNLITDLEEPDMQDWRRDASLRVRIGHTEVPLRRTYSAVGEGELLAYFGSTGRLEIAVRNGNAARRLEMGQGTVVEVARDERAA